MSSDNDQQADWNISSIKGALDVLFDLREELAQWVEEAQDGERKEELENVYNHILRIEDEYKRRLEEAMKTRSS